MRMTIGNFLASFRKEHSYTQEEVAEKLGISNRTLSSWETDKRYPDILLLPALAELYGVSVDEILQGERKAAEQAETPKEQEIEPAQEKNVISEEAERTLLRGKLSSYSSQCSILFGVMLAAIVLLMVGIMLAESGNTTAAIVLMCLAVVTLPVCSGLFSAFTGSAKRAAGRLQTEAQLSYRLLVQKTFLRTLFLFAGTVCALCLLGSLFITSRYTGGTVGSIIETVLLVITAVCALAIWFCQRSWFFAISNWGSSEQLLTMRSNTRLSDKCVRFGAIPLAVVAAMLILFGAWKPVTTETLITRNSEEELVRSLECIELTDEWDIVALGKEEAGIYYFSVEDALKNADETDKVIYVRPNFYFMQEFLGELHLVYRMEKDTEEYADLVFAREMKLPSGGSVYNFRYSLQQYPNGVEYEHSIGFAFTVTPAESVVEQGEKFSLIRTTTYNYFPLVVGLSTVIIGIDFIVCCAVYAFCKKQIRIEL